MNILITNDDGYNEWGINSLIKVLSKKHNVFVFAPDGNRSGNSTHISTFQDIPVKKISDAHWTTVGTPTDCVNIALKGNVFNCKIDAVVSGINKGQNIGTDIIYSGTCGAAKQAVLLGVPAIAVSMQLADATKDWNDINNWHFDVLSEFVSNNMETLCNLCNVFKDHKMPKEPCSYVNVNSHSLEKLKSPIFTDLCFREYSEEKYKVNEQNNLAVFFAKEANTTSRSFSDYDACQKGHIAISRIYAEPIGVPLDKNLETIKFSL